MKAIRRVFSSESGRAGLRIALALLVFAAFTVLAAPPVWWATRGVTNSRDTDDYAPINQGQLKNLAAAAVAEFEEKLEGGAGDALKALAASWSAPSARRDDYAAVNVGQLKALARPFYDRLKAKGLATAYKWEASASPADDYALANIGQAKNLFAFRLAHFDAQETVPDWWITKWGLPTNGTFDSAAMAPGGLTYRQKYQHDLNPNVPDTNENGTDDATDLASGADPKYPVLEVRIMFKPANIFRAKAGFPEFANPSTPPKFYLKKTLAVSANSKIAGKVTWFAGCSYIEVLDPAARTRLFTASTNNVDRSYAWLDDERLVGQTGETSTYALGTQNRTRQNATKFCAGSVHTTSYSSGEDTPRGAWGTDAWDFAAGYSETATLLPGTNGLI